MKSHAHWALKQLSKHSAFWPKAIKYLAINQYLREPIGAQYKR